MKYAFILLLFISSLAEAQDSLYKKRFNISAGADLLLPQTRNEFYYGDHTVSPNGMGASVARPFINSTVNRNAIAAYALFEVNIIAPKLYFQTGLYYSRYEYTEDAYRDSMLLFAGTLGNRYSFTLVKQRLVVPFGLSYRFSKSVFVSAGVLPARHSLTQLWATAYSGNTVIYPTNKTGGFSSDREISAYANVNLRFTRRFYASLGIKRNFSRHDNMYYSVGTRIILL